jgi:hypothetical protein
MHRPRQLSDAAAGRPAFPTFALCRRRIARLPQLSHPSAPPALELRVAPHLRPSRCASRPGSGLPRRLDLPAIPKENLRVAPRPHSSGGAKGEPMGCPAASLPRRASRRFSGLPRIPHPPAVPARRSPGYPGSRAPRRADWRFSGSPRILPSGACRTCVFGLPRILHYGWADDDSQFFLELCIRGETVDESSYPIGRRTFAPGSGCNIDLHPSIRAPDKPARELPHSTASCIVLPGWNCVSNSLQGHQLRKDCRPVQSVEASAKNRFICGFHQPWCNTALFMKSARAFAAVRN